MVAMKKIKKIAKNKIKLQTIKNNFPYSYYDYIKAFYFSYFFCEKPLCYPEATDIEKIPKFYILSKRIFLR